MVRHQIYIYNLFKKLQYKSKTKSKHNTNSKTEIKPNPKNPKCKHYNYRSPTLNLFKEKPTRH